MIGGKSGEFQSEISFDGSADVGGSAGVNAPATVLVLVPQDPVSGLLKAFLISRTKKCVQEDVIRFQGGVGLKFAAPISFVVLLGKEILLRCGDCGLDAASEILDFSETELRFRTDDGWSWI